MVPLFITIEHIMPCRPRQNGRHERMRLTLKKVTTRPAGTNALKQPAHLDAFVRKFDAGPPHQALNMQRLADRCSPSRDPTRPYPRSPIPCTTGSRWPPPAAASACTERKLTSRPCAPDSSSALRRSTTALACHLHALRPGAENLTTHRQPARHDIVIHVLGTFSHPVVRAGHTNRVPKPFMWSSNPVKSSPSNAGTR